MTTFEKRSISASAVRTVIDAAVAAAEAEGLVAAIAVCDESGQPKGFLRMDGAPLMSTQIATDKAYTAAGFGVPTHGWYDMVKDDPASKLGAVGGINRLLIIGGGVPLVVDGAVAGGLGISGGSAEQDQAIAEAAAATLG